MSRVEQVLASLPDTIDWPEPSPYMPSRINARIKTPAHTATPRRWIWAIMTAAVVVVALIPGTRQAVADLIVEAGVRIGVIDEVPQVGADLDLGEQTTLAEAASSVEFPIGVPDDLGDPATVYLDDRIVAMVWPGAGSLPAASGTDVAVLLTQTAGGEPRATKGISPATDLLAVMVDGAPALWIDGAEHTFTVLDQDGQPVEETSRLAANVLLWNADGVDYRLELTGGLDEARSIAESLEGS